ncbi:transporter [Brucella intermedia 229E]|uniref:Transporter n=1 Tax=Brucella intermedia 229E TaxID=1337887 RepID=U4V6S8_9HYPH|nr:transporter [Brucella intermedia 229E]
MIAKALRKLSGNNAGIVRDYLSLFSGSAGRLVVSLVYFIALANTLPTGDFGIFATASGTGVVLSRIVSLGFSSPLYRISTVKPRLLGIYTAGFLVAILVSLPLFALASWLVYFVFFSRDISFLPFAVVVFAEALFWRSTEIVIIVNNGLRRFGISAGLVIFGTATRAVAALLFMWLASAHDIAHWAWWYAAANGGVALLAALRFYPSIRLRFRPSLYMRRLSDAIAVMGAELLFYIQAELDKLLVLTVGGPATAGGLYAIIMRLVDLTALPVRSFNMMLVQKLMRAPDMLSSLRIRAGLELAVFSVSVAGLGAMVVFLQIFPNALGSSVAPIVGLLPLVLLVPGFRNLIEYQTEILYARGQSGLRTLSMVLMTAAKAFFVWLLLVNYADSHDWILGLNIVFGGLYLLSLVFTYSSIRLPAKRI